MAPTKEMETAIQVMMEMKHPRWHRPTDLRIKQFKRELKQTALSRKARRYIIRRYKSRAWMEFQGLPGALGTFPTHPKYGKSVVINTINHKVEYKIEVKSGK